MRCGRCRYIGHAAEECDATAERKAEVAARNKAYREANKAKVLARNKAYREANRAKVLARNKAYREANKAKVAACQKAYREENKAKVAACQKAYREANKAKVLARNKARYEANKAEILACQKAYREANKAKVAACQKAHYEANKAKVAARKKARRVSEGVHVGQAKFWRSLPAMLRSRVSSMRQRDPNMSACVTAKSLLSMWHSQHSRCGICSAELLPASNVHADHIVPISKGGTTSIDNLRWLCDGCNRMKHDRSDSELYTPTQTLWDGRSISDVCSLKGGRLRPRKRKAKPESGLALFGSA